MNQPFPFTKNDARRFIRSGELPEGFRGLVELFLEFDSCSNCDGVKDMNIVLRDWWGDEGPSYCDFCCGERPLDMEPENEHRHFWREKKLA